LSPVLHINTLGGLTLNYQKESEIPVETLFIPPTVKSQSLLAYLIIQRHQSHPRSRLIGMFWGDRPEQKARRSLSTALWHIRRCFPAHDPIQSTVHEVQFVFSGELILDIELLENHAAQVEIANLQNAVNLYSGNFLDGFYDDWIVNERYRLQSLFIETLTNLLKLHEGAGNHNDALHVAQELLSFDSLREDAHRILMRIYCALGQRSAALEQYRLCQGDSKWKIRNWTGLPNDNRVRHRESHSNRAQPVGCCSARDAGREERRTGFLE